MSSQTSCISQATCCSVKDSLSPTTGSRSIEIYDVAAGGYFSMLQSGWVRRDQPNLLMFWYEEMKLDELGWTEKIMKHIGYNLDQQKLEQICQGLTFR